MHQSPYCKRMSSVCFIRELVNCLKKIKISFLLIVAFYSYWISVCALPAQLRSPPMLLLRDFCFCVYILNFQMKARVDGRVGQEGWIKVVPGADQSAFPCWLLFIIYYFLSWDFQLLTWRGREVTGTSVSDAKGACVVVAMVNTKSTQQPPLLLVAIFWFFFHPLSLPPAQMPLLPLRSSLSFFSCCGEHVLSMRDVNQQLQYICEC